MPDRTAVITGANSGIGFAAARQLARHGWRVVLTARDPQRGQDALTQIRRDSGSDHAHLILLDLASFDSVCQAADQTLNRFDAIDTLICNAGVNLSRRTLTDDGIETTMQVNHFAHFLLTSLLLPRILQSDDPRIVNVTSMLHARAAQLHFDDLNLDRHWGPFYPYAASKLANIYVARQLHQRYRDRNLAAFAVHPGGVRSRLGADGDMRGPARLFWRAVQPFLLSQDTGAAPIVQLARDDSARSQSGQYFNRHRPQSPSRAAQDDRAAAQLWEHSNRLTRANWL